MNKERAITYSLLTHIRNTGTLAKGPIDIFIPLIKRVLSKMNSKGIFQGKSLLEIKNTANELYSIDFPIPVLKKILKKISKEINTEEKTHFVLYKDGAFSLNQYSFTDFEDIIDNQTKEIEEIEVLFNSFCETSELEIKDSSSIFKFIEKNKFNLSKYISHNEEKNGTDYTAEAQFVDFFKQIPLIYERIKNIYLGSIISGYIEYNSDEATRDIELLFDTNFLVGLIDLNTPESTHTCRTLLEIAKNQKFKTRILKDTIDETINLLETKARFYDKSFLQKKVNPEDVYNACDRRSLTKSDLERIADNLEKTIGNFGISIIYNTDKLKGEAKYTDEYKIFEKLRSSKKSAIHDAIALLHIKKTRKKRIREFDKVNAWFVNNSASIDGDNIFMKNGYQPETIKADDLLNILWLSNPTVNKAIQGDDLADIGLTSTLSLTLNSNLPKSQILRELDDNIHKYAKEDISDTDIVRVATRITNKQLKDIEELNELAEQEDKSLFVKRLEEEANKQKKIEETRIKKLESLFKDISIRTDELEKSKKEYLGKSENIDKIVLEKEKAEIKAEELANKLLTEQNASRKIKRDDWIKQKILKWRKSTWNEFFALVALLLSGILYIFYESDWNIENSIKYFKDLKSNILVSGIISSIIFILSITVKTLFNKYRNHSNINSYKKSLEIPEELKELNKAQ